MIYEEILEKCRFEVKPSDNDKILARVSVDFNNPPLVVKGFTIKNGVDNRTSKPCQYVSAPSFRNRFGKNSPITFMPEELWKMLSERILIEYERQVSGDEISLDDPMLEDII